MIILFEFTLRRYGVQLSMYNDSVTFPCWIFTRFRLWWLRDDEFASKLGRFKKDFTNSGSYGSARPTAIASCNKMYNMCILSMYMFNCLKMNLHLILFEILQRTYHCICVMSP